MSYGLSKYASLTDWSHSEGILDTMGTGTGVGASAGMGWNMGKIQPILKNLGTKGLNRVAATMGAGVVGAIGGGLRGGAIGIPVGLGKKMFGMYPDQKAKSEPSSKSASASQKLALIGKSIMNPAAKKRMMTNYRDRNSMGSASQKLKEVSKKPNKVDKDVKKVASLALKEAGNNLKK